MDILIFVLLIVSIVFNYYLYKQLEKAIEKLSKERRKHLKYKTELNRVPRDYEDGEECYKGIAGGDR